MSGRPVKPPGFVRTASIVLAKDLRIEGRTRETIASTLLFALVVLVIFGLSFDLDTMRRLGASRLVPGVIWITLAFSGIVGFTRSFRLERASEAWVAVALAPVDRGAVFAGKWVANLVLLVALEIVLFPLTAVLFDVDLSSAAVPLAGVTLLHSAGLAGLGTLLGGIVSRLNRGEALLATLFLPASTPLFLSAVHCTSSILEGKPLSADRGWLLLTAGLDVLFVLVSLLVFDAILED